MKNISILGSTGSIGTNTLNVVEANKKDLKVKYLTAGSNGKLLVEQALKFHPNAIAIADDKQYSLVKGELKSSGIEVLAGREGVLEISRRNDVDMVLNSIVGAPGLEPTYLAIQAGNNIALSNKESLVMAGDIIMSMLKEKNLTILPVDSEHSAIFQCLVGEEHSSIKRLILTGSGGPFRKYPLEKFSKIKPENALKHPTWNMGRKITIDSATMMNKGLEVIEAKWLFDIPLEKVDIIIHPQSIIHSMVEFIDGSMKAQLGLPDMKLPIQYAIFYPERRNVAWENTDFTKISELNFEAPDYKRFPCIRLAYESLERGGTAPGILNVVNEQAVYAFLDNKIKFTDIPGLVEKALSDITIIDNPNIQDILNIEQIGIEFVNREISGVNRMHEISIKNGNMTLSDEEIQNEIIEARKSL